MKKIFAYIFILGLVFYGKSAFAVGDCHVELDGSGITSIQCSPSSVPSGEYELFVDGVSVDSATRFISSTLQISVWESDGNNDLNFFDMDFPMEWHAVQVRSGEGINELKIDDVSVLCWSAQTGGVAGSWIFSNVGTCYSSGGGTSETVMLPEPIPPFSLSLSAINFDGQMIQDSSKVLFSGLLEFFLFFIRTVWPFLLILICVSVLFGLAKNFNFKR